MQQVIVIGGSIAGLLFARVLSDYFDKVIILERDSLTDKVTSRSGVPQDRHGHLLMAKGQQILESFFPTLKEDFRHANLPEIQWGIDTRILMSGNWMKETDLGIRTFACSRIWLENYIRRSVIGISNVQIIDQARVETLTSHNGIIDGVVYQQGKDQQTLSADLVVDASGKQSKLPDWLAALGYSTPDVTTIDPGMGYATRWYKKPADFNDGWKLFISYARPECGLYRSGAIVESEGDTWMAILGGTNGDFAPTHEEEYEQFLKSLASPKVYKYLQSAEPTSPIYGYRDTANRWRHYEKLVDFPSGIIAVGDAVSAFNPIYAQGMTVITLEAQLLAEMLAISPYDTNAGFSKSYQQNISKIVQQAWRLSATADSLLPNAIGVKPNPLLILGQKYINALTEIMPKDVVISRAILNTMHMLESPLKLTHPQILIKYGLSNIRKHLK